MKKSKLKTVICGIVSAMMLTSSVPLVTSAGGFGDFEYEFSRYEQAPADVQEREVASRHTDDEE